MSIPESERDRILQEELIKCELRDERLKRRRPQLFLVMIIWTIVLVGLVMMSNHIH